MSNDLPKLCILISAKAFHITEECIDKNGKLEVRLFRLSFILLKLCCLKIPYMNTYYC